MPVVPQFAHAGQGDRLPVEPFLPLEDLRKHIDSAGMPRADQDDLVCGYQLQHKSWVADPDGVMWEAFFTEGVVDTGYGAAEMPDPA